MAKQKFIVVKKKETQREVKRVDVNHLYNDFQIGYEAGKLEKDYPQDKYLIFMQKM